MVNYRGTGTVCLESRIYRFEPGNALLVKPGVFHRYFGVPKTGFSWLFFTFDLHKEAEPDTLPGAPVKLQSVDLERMDAAAHHYLHSSSELDLFEAGLHMGRILQVLGDRATIEHLHPSPEKEAEACDLLRKITCFVNTHMDQALRIKDLADQVGMSESHLRRVFREQFGPSLGAYLRYSRLTRGVQLIHRGDLSISEVATLSGFESVQAFSLSFRNAIGMPPTAYRKYLQDGNAPLRIPMDAQPQEQEKVLS